MAKQRSSKEQPKFINRNTDRKVSYGNVEQEKPDYVRYDKPKPITENHRKYHNLCMNDRKRIVLCKGWAGTSKSITAAYFASQAVLDGRTTGITLVRSLEGVGKDPGAYPGDDYLKNFPKLRQLATYISSFLNDSIENLVREGVLNIVGLYDIQGQDFSNRWFIVTECQTLTPEQMYQVCTRGADKIILEGDTCPAQLTNRKIKPGEDGLSFLMNTIGDLDFVGKVSMDDEDDIVRKDYMKQVIVRMMPELEKLRNN